jgi:hypothetical protein
MVGKRKKERIGCSVVGRNVERVCVAECDNWIG